jgi:hypothetical protein
MEALDFRGMGKEDMAWADIQEEGELEPLLDLQLEQLLELDLVLGLVFWRR